MTDVLLMGRKSVTARCLEYLYKSDNFNVAGVMTDSHLKNSVTADLARKLDVPLYDFEEATQALKCGELKFDIGISMLYWRKLKGAFLQHPARGCINFHPAPLPGYKGTGGYNLAIIEGLSEWAVSAHYVDAGIDTGPIIQVTTFPIDPEKETIDSLEKQSQNKLFELFLEVMGKIESSNGMLDSHENVGGRYVSRNEMEAMKEVRPGDDVDRKIRAFWFPPYDGAYLVIGGSKYTLVNRALLEKMAPPDRTTLYSEPHED